MWESTDGAALHEEGTSANSGASLCCHAWQHSASDRIEVSLSHAFAPPPCFEKAGRVRTRSPVCDVTTSRRRPRGRRTSLTHVTHASVLELGVQFLYVVRGVVRAQWLREVVLRFAISARWALATQCFGIPSAPGRGEVRRCGVSCQSNLQWEPHAHGLLIEHMCWRA